MPDPLPPYTGTGLPYPDDDPAYMMESFRDGAPYEAQARELILSRPGAYYMVEGKWEVPGIAPGYSHRYTVDAAGNILDAIVYHNTYYQRTGAVPGPAGVALAPFPPEEEEE
jgi:hypothetical protein